jgi:hypothetical protein
MGSTIEPKFRGLRHSTRFGGLVAASRLYRLQRVHALFESCVKIRSDSCHFVSLRTMHGAATLS